MPQKCVLCVSVCACACNICVSGTWQGVHCGSLQNVLLWLALHIAHPTVTPGTIGHTLSLCVWRQ